MKKKELLLTVAILLVALLFIIIVMLISGTLKFSNSTKGDSSELGEITTQAEDYDEVLDYNPEGDELVKSDTFIVINNPELIYKNLTLMALGDLEKDLSTWLTSKGYGSEEFIYLNIIESSVVDDKTYPYFELESSGELPRIKAYYDLENLAWVFDFK